MAVVLKMNKEKCNYKGMDEPEQEEKEVQVHSHGPEHTDREE